MKAAADSHTQGPKLLQVLDFVRYFCSLKINLYQSLIFFFWLQKSRGVILFMLLVINCPNADKGYLINPATFHMMNVQFWQKRNGPLKELYLLCFHKIRSVNWIHWVNKDNGLSVIQLYTTLSSIGKYGSTFLKYMHLLCFMIYIKHQIPAFLEILQYHYSLSILPVLHFIFTHYSSLPWL